MGCSLQIAALKLFFSFGKRRKKKIHTEANVGIRLSGLKTDIKDIRRNVSH